MTYAFTEHVTFLKYRDYEAYQGVQEFWMASEIVYLPAYTCIVCGMYQHHIELQAISNISYC